MALTWIMPTWSLRKFPGQGVPSAIFQPSRGLFWALATRALMRILNSSYSLCSTTKRWGSARLSTLFAELTSRIQAPVQTRAARYKGQTNLNMQSAFCFDLQAADRKDKGSNYLTGNRRSPDVEENMCGKAKNGQELYLHLPSLSDKVRVRLVLQVLLLSLQKHSSSNRIASASWLSAVTRLRNSTKHP